MESVLKEGVCGRQSGRCTDNGARALVWVIASERAVRKACQMQLRVPQHSGSVDATVVGVGRKWCRQALEGSYTPILVKPYKTLCNECALKTCRRHVRQTTCPPQQQFGASLRSGIGRSDVER